ncbi:KAP family P-loop NTPase fold protein [Halorubrum salinum]|uniref:KAP family P-loop NTPase fold protein n=1 Tax=Halorubrum salinum TaxID=767517 RepID=UPI002111679D|nr:P-loop NTPase fold protein [Halorubrum salinum]
MGEDAAEDPDVHFGATDDHPAEVDQLGFQPYVTAVKYFLTNDETEPPLTLSVEGEWGSGKSSFMSQLRRELEEEGETTIEFNPWKHEQQEALWASFALTFVESLKSSVPWYKRPGKFAMISWRRLLSETSNGALAKFAAILAISVVVVLSGLWFWLNIGIEWVSASSATTGLNLRFWLGTSGVVVSILATVDLSRRAYGVWATSINRSFKKHLNDPSYRERTEFLQAFQSDLERILDTYAGNDPVYVFMDDVDRCTVPKAADLMRSINLMVSSNSDLIFIIGLDRERVAAGIAAKHETLLNHINDETEDEAIDFGYQYLEKFIQIPFVVPEPKKEDIQKLVRRDVLNKEITKHNTGGDNIESIWQTELSPRFKSSLDDVVKMAAPALENNPRQIKRFINLYRLRAVLAESEGLLAGKNEEPAGDMITLFQLAKFVVISIQYPTFVTVVANDQTALKRMSKFANDNEGDVSEHEVLQDWGSVDPLLDLLTYGEGDQYRMDQVSVVDLQKISPRVDRPIDTDQEESEKTVQIAFFDSAEYDPDKIQSQLRSVSETLELDLQLTVFENAKEKPIAEVDELYYCFIWIVDPSLLAKTWFQRLRENAPEQLQVISLSPNTEFIDSPTPQDFWSVDGLDELTDVLKQRLQTIDATDMSGGSRWEEWQRSLSGLQSTDDTEIIE